MRSSVKNEWPHEVPFFGFIPRTLGSFLSPYVIRRVVEVNGDVNGLFWNTGHRKELRIDLPEETQESIDLVRREILEDRICGGDYGFGLLSLEFRHRGLD